MTATRVVTLPPQVTGTRAEELARTARDRGADALEVRNDLHGDDALDLGALAAIVPLLVSERGRPLAERWEGAARWVDRELPAGTPPSARAVPVVSWHTAAPQRPEEALARWALRPLPAGALVKHVEPLGPPADGARLLETQRLLLERFGEGRVTVLATGSLALPFRCLLARRNAFDYLAFEPAWAAAPGQRLLEDAVREVRRPGSGLRTGILGTRIAHSRSPRIHPQPFDRIDLPEEAAVEELVDALSPWYRGFAVTSPFKKRLARHLGSPAEAVNTLVRGGASWATDNTDVDGARRLLERLGPGEITALGDGGATAALRLAAAEVGRSVGVLRRADIGSAPLTGTFVWTWPAGLAAPPALRFEAARVALIGYGAPARAVAAEVRRLGGTPVSLGEAWFVAQARSQRRLWDTAT